LQQRKSLKELPRAPPLTQEWHFDAINFFDRMGKPIAMDTGFMETLVSRLC